MYDNYISIRGGKILKRSHKPSYGEKWTGTEASRGEDRLPLATNQWIQPHPKHEVSWHHFPKEPSSVWVPASTSNSAHLLTFAYSPQPHPISSGAWGISVLSTVHWGSPLPIPWLPLSHFLTFCKWQAWGAWFSICIPKGKLPHHLTSQRQWKEEWGGICNAPHMHPFAEGGRVAIHVLRRLPAPSQRHSGNFMTECGTWLSFDYSTYLASDFLFLGEPFSLINLYVWKEKKERKRKKGNRPLRT